MTTIHLVGGWRSRFFVALAFAGLLAIPSAYAINASPHPIAETQPDGTAITLRVHGSKGFNWHSDAQNFTVVRSQGRYVYARRGKSGNLEPTGLEVGKADPVANGLRKRVLPSQAVINQQRASASGAQTSSATALAQSSPLGTVKNLVVLVRFSDHTGRTLPTPADINVLFNENDPATNNSLAPTGSVKEVYLENSYGQLTLDSTVSYWITVSNTERYYADGQSGSSKLWEALREALDALDDDPNFILQDFDQDNDGNIDAVAFIHSGYGAEWGGTDAYGAVTADRIWSHRWAIQNPAWSSSNGVTVSDYHISPGVWSTTGSEIGRIGVISHETGHFFGLPDLYDTDSGAGDGIGSYGMMANSWGFNGSQLYPPHFSPWSKIQLGWLTPTVADTTGRLSLNAVENSPEVIRVDQGFPSNEYLLIENRQPSGFDARMPQGGLAIWHIDDQTGFNTQGYPGQSGWPANGNHYRVALLQADGNYNLEKGDNRGDSGDVFRSGGTASLVPYQDSPTYPNTDSYQGGNIASSGNWFTNISSSGATMEFDYATDGGDPGSGGDDLAASDVSTSGGQVSGTYLNTHANDGSYQVLAESHSGGRPSSRYDMVEHVWAFDLSGGNNIFHIDARVDAGNDNDSGFELYWSTSATASGTLMMTIPESQTIDTEATHNLIGASGRIYIRAKDTNRVSDQNSNDRLLVDHMFVDGGGPVIEEPPAAPSNPSPDTGSIDVVADTLLSWSAGSGATSHDVAFGTSNPPAFPGNQTGTTYDPGLLDYSTTYFWQITERSGDFSTPGPVWSFTTEAEPPLPPPPGAITLTVDGYKIKGKHKADLSWGNTNVSTVDITRTRGSSVIRFDDTPNSGKFIDNIDTKGGATYIYQVCEAGSTSVCSNEVTIVF